MTSIFPLVYGLLIAELVLVANISPGTQEQYPTIIPHLTSAAVTTLSIRAVYWRCVRPLHLQLPRHDQVLPGGDNLPAPRHRLHGQYCLHIQAFPAFQWRS